MKRFTHKDLVNTFEGVRVGKDGGMWKYCYVFSSKKTGSDYLEVYASHDDNEFSNEIRFLVDNFPAQRRSYHTNIPFRNVDDFEETLKKINVEIPNRRVRRECETCKNIMPLSYFNNDNERCVTCQ